MNFSLNRFLKESPTMMAIKHQSNEVLFDDLVALFEAVREEPVINPQVIKRLTQDVNKVVSDALDMKVDFQVDLKKKHTAYMHLPMLDKNHPLLNKSKRKVVDNRQLREVLGKDLKDSWAAVNRDTGRVSGFLTKIEVKIVLGLGFITRDSMFTPQETAAVFLHELGHGWTYFYMLGGTLRTNVIMHAAMHDYEFGKDAKKDNERILIIEQAANIELPQAVRTAAKGNDAVAISLIERQAEMQRSEFGTTGMDESGSEAIADQFTARMGGGVHVVTGLHKLERKGIITRSALFMLHILAILNALKLYGASMLISVFLTDPTRGDYDDPYKRAKRVREQLVASLRSKDLSPTERRTRLQELDAIDEVMEKVKDNEPLFDFIWRRVIEGGNSRVKAKLNQERLESLINNDLYVLGSVLEVNKS